MQMSEKHPEMSWEVMDVRKMTCKDSSFDIAIDKVSIQPTWETNKPCADDGSRVRLMLCFPAHCGILRTMSKRTQQNTSMRYLKSGKDPSRVTR